MCRVPQSTSSCYSQLSRIFKGKGAVSLCVCSLLPMGVLGTAGTRPKRPFGPLRDVKRLLNPIRLAHSGRMTVEVLIGLWDMRMLIDMHSRGATDLRASTAEHAGVFGPDAAAAAPTVATFELVLLATGDGRCSSHALCEGAGDEVDDEDDRAPLSCRRRAPAIEHGLDGPLEVEPRNPTRKRASM